MNSYFLHVVRDPQKQHVEAIIFGECGQASQGQLNFKNQLGDEGSFFGSVQASIEITNIFNRFKWTWLGTLRYAQSDSK